MYILGCSGTHHNPIASSSHQVQEGGIVDLAPFEKNGWCQRRSMGRVTLVIVIIVPFFFEKWWPWPCGFCSSCWPPFGSPPQKVSTYFVRLFVLQRARYLPKLFCEENFLLIAQRFYFLNNNTVVFVFG